ncbi:MAG: hypothetical protein HDR27_05815 [Lachnospiraceae bacterium]|nr:hypothetical protein [Lachnospiraceae bacterium]
MTQQYQDILSNASIEIGPEDQRRADRYYGIAMTLKAMDVVVLMTFPIVFCMYFSRWNSFYEKIMWLPYWTMFLLCFFYLLNKRLYFRKIRSFLLMDCDPVRMLSCIMALISHSNRKKGRNWGLHFYNVCTCLYYAGRFEDVHRILQLFPKYCPAEADRLKYELLCARLAYHEKDEKALYMHCNYLNSWAGRLKKRNLFYGIYQETMQLPMLLKMEKDGAWQQAYGMLRQADVAVGQSGRRSMLSKVKANFLLYRMAKGMGDEQCAAYHREFVRQNGGSLWYRRDVG